MSQNKTGNENMNWKQWGLSSNCPQKIKMMILIHDL